METLFTLLLFIHIGSGGIGLLLGSWIMLRKKGDANHQKNGRWFFYALLTTGISSLIMSILHPSSFLFAVGIFTIYMLLTGKRYLRWQSPNTFVKKQDWALSIGMVLAGIWLVYKGIYLMMYGQFFGVVFLTFASFGFVFVRNDIRHYRKKSSQLNFGLMEHIQRMTGAYIASLTAFFVVNAKFFPDFIPLIIFWLLPSAIFTPLIIKWTTAYGTPKS